MVKVVVLLTYVFFSASGSLRAEAYPNDPLTFCLVDDINNGRLFVGHVAFPEVSNGKCIANLC
jgi:hypothetical protein